MSEELALYSATSGLNEYFTREELVIPEYKVINVSTNKITQDTVIKHRGEFIHTSSNEIKKEINAVVLKFVRGSVYNEGIYPKTNMVCFTDNFFSPTQLEPVSPICRKYEVTQRGRSIKGVCPKACWVATDDGKRHPPVCKEYTSFIIYDLDNKSLSQITMRGMNLYTNSPLKRFLSHVATTRKELFCFSTRLGTVPGNVVFPTVSRADQALLITFSDVTYLPNWEEYMAMSKALSNVSVVTEESSPAAENTVDSDDLPF